MAARCVVHGLHGIQLSGDLLCWLYGNVMAKALYSRSLRDRLYYIKMAVYVIGCVI